MHPLRAFPTFPTILVLLSVLMIVTIETKATYKGKGFKDRDIAKNVRERFRHKRNKIQELRSSEIKKRQSPIYSTEDQANWELLLNTIGLPYQNISSSLEPDCITPLSGTIPPWIGNLTFLSVIVFDTCQLTGIIPNTLGELKLSHLDLSVNNLTGTIPSELGGTFELNLGSNILTGTIPSELGLSVIIELSNNNLTGTIPATLISNQTTDITSILFLDNNQLTGTIPNVLNWESYGIFSIANNRLTGTIPTAIGTWSLALLQLSHNQLTGTRPTEFFSSTLLELSLGNNGLTGTIPTEIGKCTNLELFYANNCNLSATIPSEIGLNYNLQNLDVSYNFLELSDFAWSLTCSGSYNFNFGHNQIAQIPTKLMTSYCATELTSVLSLGDNAITTLEPLYIALLDVDKTPLSPNVIGTLDLSNNQISGTLSRYFFVPLWVTVNLANNKLSGTVPPIAQSVNNNEGTRLQSVIISNNNFSGAVPSFITELTTMMIFAGANNYFDEIPDGFFLASSFKMVDLSSNNILVQINQIASFNDDNLAQFGLLSLVNNRISGNLGVTFLRNTTTTTIYLMNNELQCVDLPLWCAGTSVWPTGTGRCYPCISPCGDGLRWDVEQCDDGNTENGDGCSSICDIEDNWSCYEPPVTYIDVILASPSRCSKNFPYAAVIAGTIVPTVFICFATIITIYVWRILKEKNDFIKQLEKKLQLKDSYIIADEALSFARVLGEGNFGKVYMGYLDNTTKVAIKELKNAKKDDTEFNNFVEEAKLVSSIPPHPNIVQFIGICISEQKQTIFIVIQYIANKNLHAYLATETQETIVTYEQQLELCLGIAAGMHHLSKFGVVHNDLAARNILVEELTVREEEGGTKCSAKRELISKVSDFGMAWSKAKRDTKGLLLPVRWTAPEVLLDFTTSSSASDVWSYGITMHEIFNKCLDIPYKSFTNEEVCSKVTKEMYHLSKPNVECPDHIYNVMLSCWNFNPNDRPSFGKIFEELKSFQTMLTNSAQNILQLDSASLLMQKEINSYKDKDISLKSTYKFIVNDTNTTYDTYAFEENQYRKYAK